MTSPHEAIIARLERANGDLHTENERLRSRIRTLEADLTESRRKAARMEAIAESDEPHMSRWAKVAFENVVIEPR